MVLRDHCMIIVLDFLTQYLQYDRRREMFLFSSEMCVNRVIQLLVLLIVYSYCLDISCTFKINRGDTLLSLFVVLKIMDLGMQPDLHDLKISTGVLPRVPFKNPSKC